MAEKCKSLNNCLEELKEEHISPEDLNRIIDECVSILESKDGGKNGYQAIIKEILLLLQKHIISLVGCHQDEIRQLNEKVANFEASVKQLEEDKQQGLIAIQKLEQDMQELKGDKQSLLVGQIAFNIEAELRKIVLNGVEIRSYAITCHKTIPQIREAINSRNTPYDPIFKFPEHKGTAELNLNDLEREFPKDPDYYYEIIKDLKKTRNIKAHPKLPLEPDEAKKYVEDSDIESSLKELVYELLDLMKAIKEHS